MNQPNICISQQKEKLFFFFFPRRQNNSKEAKTVVDCSKVSVYLIQSFPY